MVGGIKASSPGVKSMSAKLFLDLPTMSAPSGEERRMDAAAQVEYLARADRRLHGRTQAGRGRAAVMSEVAAAGGTDRRRCTGAPLNPVWTAHTV